MRSLAIRQRESARHYLDLTAVSPNLRIPVEMTVRSLGFTDAALYVTDDDNEYLLIAVGFADSDRPPAVNPRIRADGAELDNPTLRLDPRSTRVLVGREGVPIGHLNFGGPPNTDDSGFVATALDECVSVVCELLEAQRDRPRIVRDRIPHLSAAVFADAEAEAGRVVPFYQPIVDLRDGSVAAYEALARWEHPERGVIDPAEFIATAERSEVVLDLDLAIMTQAVADVARWRRRNSSLRLNTNISAQHLQHPGCVDQIIDVVVSGGMAPADVTLEITEASAVSLGGRSVRFVERLQEAGFLIWLDDLGAGWSSLDRLIRLPVDGVKIDRGLASSDTVLGEALVRAVCEVAESSGISATVEGIETVSGLDTARHTGSRFGQGYFWSRPHSANDVDSAAITFDLTDKLTADSTLDVAVGIIAEIEGATVVSARALLYDRARRAELPVDEYASDVVRHRIRHRSG